MRCAIQTIDFRLQTFSLLNAPMKLSLLNEICVMGRSWWGTWGKPVACVVAPVRSAAALCNTSANRTRNAGRPSWVEKSAGRTNFCCCCLLLLLWCLFVLFCLFFFYVDRTNQKLTQGKISSLVKLRMWNRIFFLFSVSAHATGHTSGGNHHW